MREAQCTSLVHSTYISGLFTETSIQRPPRSLIYSPSLVAMNESRIRYSQTRRREFPNRKESNQWVHRILFAIRIKWADIRIWDLRYPARRTLLPYTLRKSTSSIGILTLRSYLLALVWASNWLLCSPSRITVAKMRVLQLSCTSDHKVTLDLLAQILNLKLTRKLR